MVSDPEASTPVTYVDSVGEVEEGLWSLANGVMTEGEFIPMERGTHRESSTGKRIVFAPLISCDESCSSTPINPKTEGKGVANWIMDMVGTFGSLAPVICSAWIRASVYRSKIETMDAQLPALYVCGDSHRGKTLMATVATRMLGANGERPHANMTSSSNAGVFLVAASRSSLPFIMDEVKPYAGIYDNDLVKSLVNGDIPAKSTRGGKLRASQRVRSMPVLVSEFAPGDTSSVTNRVFTLNLVTLRAMANTAKIPGWVKWADKHADIYQDWAARIYHDASMTTLEEFVKMWRACGEDAMAICDDATMTLNRSVTATTIALLGFKLLNQDSGGRLDHLYTDYCNDLSKCLREMSRLVAEVSSMGRFITSIRSGWSSLEHRYSTAAADRVFSHSPTYGFVIDHSVLHGILIDSKRIDTSRLGNPATVAMILEGEGFKRITDSYTLRGRYAMSLATFKKKDWAHDMSRLTELMTCACGKFICNVVDTQEDV
jgi:hypothetical protein